MNKEKINLFSDDSEKTSSSLDDILGGYSSAMEVELDEPKEESNTNEVSFELEDKTDPKLYYQTGKKKGQRRPNAKVSVTKQPDQTQETISGEILSGAVFLTLIDLIFPLIISALNNQFSKKKVNPDKMRLSSTQKKELTPLCDAVAKQIQVTANPTALLITSLIGIYGLNFYMLKMED